MANLFIFLIFIFLETIGTLSFSETLPINYRIDYLQLRIPNQSPSLGLVGAHLDIKPLQNISWLYLGAGGYGALRGQNSGFFALGLETGIDKNFDNDFYIDSGLFLGSGGGHDLASVIDNGDFIETHASVLYDFSYFLAGLGLSHWEFFEGGISDNQIMLNFIFPSDFYFEIPGQKIFKNNNFSKDYFSMTGMAEFPSKNARNLSQAPMSPKLGLIGAEFGHYFNQDVYLFLNMNGAVYGNQNGYAEALAGLGYQFNFEDPKWSVLTQVGAGSAGGGGVDTRGGLVLEPALGLEFRPSDQYGIDLLGGYLWTPDLGSSTAYQAWVLGLNLKYYFSNDLSNYQNNEESNQESNQTWRVRLGNEYYSSESINLFSIKLEGFYNSNIYLTGQTAFAYTGHAAGYFSGMMGVGVQSPEYKKFALYAELLGGAAGGAGLDIGSGFLIDPLVGIEFNRTHAFSFYTALGKTFSPNHSFSSPTLEMGFGYSFEV